MLCSVLWHHSTCLAGSLSCSGDTNLHEGKEEWNGKWKQVVSVSGSYQRDLADRIRWKKHVRLTILEASYLKQNMVQEIRWYWLLFMQIKLARGPYSTLTRSIARGKKNTARYSLFRTDQNNSKREAFSSAPHEEMKLSRFVLKHDAFDCSS